MKSSIIWRDDAENAFAEERATVADVKLWVGGQLATRHWVDDGDGETVDVLTIPLWGLANGLVRDWWSIFGGRDRKFSLKTYREGATIPDIRFQFDGVSFKFWADDCRYENPGVMFGSCPPETLLRSEAETRLQAFVESILARIADKDFGEADAAVRWRRITESRTDPEESAFCEAAGALGLDPYRIDDKQADAILEAATVFSGEPLLEFLAGFRKNKEQSSGHCVEWLREAENRAPSASLLGDLAEIGNSAAVEAPARGGEPPWALGYRRARSVRKILSLRPGSPFHSYSAIADRFGASSRFESAPRIEGLRAVRYDHEDGIHVHVSASGTAADYADAAQQFSLARAIGDAACYPEPSVAPVNELKEAVRQASGRAFAAEFLAPIDEVAAMRADGKSDIDIAGAFGVSTKVIAHQIENADRIREAQI